jgi:tetratricopeptide (TPR) repeat protein
MAGCARRRAIGTQGAAVFLALWLGACASTPRGGLPAGEDYVYPKPAAGELTPDGARRLRAGWDHVLAGDAAAAERTFRKLLERQPGSVAARVGLGYARLRLRRFDAASDDFEAALRQRPDYVPALVGAGGVALAAGLTEQALARYRRALELEPDDARLRKRLAELKLNVTERTLETAREARARGEHAAALTAYQTALAAAPEVSGVRLELAELLLADGQGAAARELLAADPAGDRTVALRLAALREQEQDYDGALEAYRRVLARDPGDGEANQRLQALRARLEFQRLPEEYRRIFSAPRLTRAELAALLATKVTALQRLKPGEGRVAVDVSGSWARESILRLLALDVLDVYPNHTFQPGAAVRRGDMAQALARVLDLLGTRRGRGPAITDMSASNLFHAAATRVVGAGLMDVTPSGAFEPWRPVSGREAADVVDALARLTGP